MYIPIDKRFSEESNTNDYPMYFHNITQKLKRVNETENHIQDNTLFLDFHSEANLSPMAD